MADPASIILSLPTVIDICLRLGHSLLTTLTTFRYPDPHSRLHQFTLDLTTGSIHDILLFFKNHSQNLHPNFAIQLYEATMILAEVLDEVAKVSNRALHHGGEGGRIQSILKRLRYALWDARKITNACEELEKWQVKFVRRAHVYMDFAFRPIAQQQPQQQPPQQQPQQQHLQQLQHHPGQHPGSLIS